MDRSKWEYKKLGEVCTLLNGYAFKSNKYVDNGIRVMRITNVQKGEIVDDDPKYYPLSSQSEILRYMLKENDLLVSLTGNVGRVGLLHRELLPAALNQRVACLRIKDQTIDLKYIFHLMNSDLFESECIANSQGIAQKNMSTKWLENYKLPVPPISDQQRIVAELDCLNEMIALKQEQLKEFDKLAQSIFYDMFGEEEYELRKIKEIAKVKIGPFGSSLHQYDYITGGTPLVNPIHMINGKIVADNDFTITEEKKSELTSYLLKTNDIVFGRRGDIGRCALVTDKENGYLCGTGSMFVRFDIDIVPTYALFELSSKEVKKYLLDNAKGATMLNINGGIVENIEIPLPPLALQQQFAEKIQAIESQKELVKQSIAETQQLLDSRMDYYFN